RLYGLWTPDGLGANTVGPLPFGHVTDLPDSDWEGAVRRLRPDVVYALLNWRAVPFAHAVLSARLGVPFVWHFKESPFRSIARGTWPQLVDLVTGADAAVLSSPEELAWFEQALAGRLDPARTLALDGDLPKADWLGVAPAGGPRLSDRDGELHTVALGRPLGLDPHVVAVLARAGIHLHLHGQVRAPGPKGDWVGWIGEARALAPDHVHLHPHVGPDRWMEVLPRYDAGWLHHLRSANGGDLGRATWDDLNYPARIPPLVAAGVPLLQQASPGCVVAAQELVGRLGVGVLYQDLDDLAVQLADDAAMAGRRAAAATVRHQFTFDHHADRLIALFREVAGR
ncbi:MAG: glycosyl transferase family 2, partial [Actinomycetes bacterium]